MCEIPPWRRVSAPAGVAPEALEEWEHSSRGYEHRDLGFSYLKRLRASEFGKDPAWVPNPVLHVLRVL